MRLLPDKLTRAKLKQVERKVNVYLSAEAVELGLLTKLYEVFYILLDYLKDMFIEVRETTQEKDNDILDLVYNAIMESIQNHL